MILSYPKDEETTSFKILLFLSKLFFKTGNEKIGFFFYRRALKALWLNENLYVYPRI